VLKPSLSQQEEKIEGQWSKIQPVDNEESIQRNIFEQQKTVAGGHFET
jgi:hypothetical protein